MDTPDSPPLRDDTSISHGSVHFADYAGGWFSPQMTAYFKSNQDKVSTFAVSDFSYDFEAGRFYAILGGVGAGKTSLLLAVLDELDCKQGSVRKHGSIAYVSQNPFLLNASVRDNILFHSAFDERRYKDCLLHSCLFDDIKQFPGGDLTEIGERGINLSGGQKQRIAIARALYADKDIYLVDDCLSALDAEVGKKIFYEVFKRQLHGKTILMVTHSAVFLPDVDQVLLLKNGRLEAAGDYEVVRKNRAYLDYYYETARHEAEAHGGSLLEEDLRLREDNPETGRLDELRTWRAWSRC